MKRKLLSLALTAILAVSSAATVMAAKKQEDKGGAGVNVFGYGGFDTQADVDRAKGSSASVKLNTTEQKSGAGCLQVDVTGNWGSADFLAPFPVGETYTISFDYKTNAADAPMTLIFQFTGGNSYKVYPSQHTFTHEWQHAEFVLTHDGINHKGEQTDGTGHYDVRYGDGQTKATYFIDNFSVIPHGNVEGDYSSLKSTGSKPMQENTNYLETVPARKNITPVTFSDVENHWAKDTVNTLATYDYIDGMGKGIYSPNSQLTRAQFVKMVVDTYHLDERVYDGAFSDINGDEWFASYVTIANYLGLLDSALTYGGKFYPDKAITRAEAASIAERAAKSKNAEKKAANLSFADIGGLDLWAQTAVKDAAEYGLILGYEDGSFKPNNTITRAEAAQILYRIAEISTRFNIYVDADNGDDKNDGSKNAPLKTVYAATDMVSNYNKDMRNDITVYIRGNHYLDKTWNFGVDDSGTNGYQIIYTSWGEEKPELSMGRKFTGFTLHDADKNIYKTYVGVGTITRQAYFNEKKGIRSRSVGPLTNTQYINGTYIVDNTELLDYAYPDEIELQYHIHWTDPFAGVDKVEPTEDGKVKITPSQTSWKKSVGSMVNRYPGTPSEIPSYIMNAYELLDQKGEWYMNIHDGYMYYIPRDGEDMSTMEMIIPVGEDLIMAKSNGIADPIHNITFNNLKFCDVGWTYPTNMDGFGYGQNVTVDWDGDGVNEDCPAGVTVYDGWYINFTNNVFTRMGKVGLNTLGGMKFSNVIGNEFYDLSGRGVTFGGVCDRTALSANPLAIFEHSKFNNNYVHDVCTDYLGMGAVTVGYPRYTEICHNEIANTPYSGIHIGWGWAGNAEKGSDMYEIKMNHNFIQETNNDRLYDGGSIYSLGAQRLDALDNKSEWSYNYFVNHRNGYSTVYPDEGSTNWEVAYNVTDNRDVPVQEFNWDHTNIEADKWYWLMLHVPTIKYNHFHDNYSTTKTIRQNAPDNEYGTVYEYPDAEWPEEAQEIIRNAGVEDAYKANFDFEGAKYLVVNKRTYDVPMGTTSKLSVKVTGRYFKEYDLSDFNPQYYVSQPGVLEIAPDGTMKAVGTGLVDVVITAEVNGRTQMKQVKVYAGETVEEVLASPAQLNLIQGNSATLGVTGKTSFDRDADIMNQVEIAYKSTDESVATVDENGKVTAVGNGEGNIEMTVTFEGKTFNIDVPVKIINYGREDSLDLPYEMAPAGMFSAGSWSAGARPNDAGNGVVVKGSPSYYLGEMITNKLIAFDMKITSAGSWPSLTFGCQERMGTYNTDDTYLIGFKSTFIELQRFNAGKRTMIFGEDMYTPVGGPGVPNDGGSIFKQGETYSVIAGILDEPGGTRVVLTVNGVNIFDYTDTGADRAQAKGYFGIYEGGGTFEFTPYTGRTNQ